MSIFFGFSCTVSIMLPRWGWAALHLIFWLLDVHVYKCQNKAICEQVEVTFIESLRGLIRPAQIVPAHNPGGKNRLLGLPVERR